MFYYVPFHLEPISTDMTFPTWFIWLSICKRQLGQCTVKNVENILRINKESQDTWKKSINMFLVPSQRYQDFGHILGNPQF